MPHVMVEVQYVPKGYKGINYVDSDGKRKLAKKGDRFELHLRSALAQARKGHLAIVGTSARQAKAIAERKAGELTEAQDRVKRLKAELAEAKQAAKEASMAPPEPEKADKKKK